MIASGTFAFRFDMAHNVKITVEHICIEMIQKPPWNRRMIHDKANLSFAFRFDRELDKHKLTHLVGFFTSPKRQVVRKCRLFGHLDQLFAIPSI